MFKKWLALVVLFAGLGQPLFMRFVHAAGTQYSFNTVISLGDNYATKVRTIVDIEVDGNIETNLRVPTYGANVKGIEVNLADKTPLDATVSDGFLNILLSPIQASSQAKHSLVISYSSSLGVRFGDSFLIMIPPSDYGELDVKKEAVTINSALSLGTPVWRGMRPNSSSLGVGSQVNSWASKKGTLNEPIGLLFGDYSVAEVTYGATLENTSLWWRAESFVLPPDTNQQRVFVNSITPKPSKITLDQDGNIIAEYTLGPRQKIDVSAEMSVLVNSYVYSLDSNLGVNDISQQLRDRYTSLIGTWQNTPIEIAGTENLSVTDLIEEIYKAVATEYADVTGENWYEAALARSNALVGELRANGVPARVVIGATFGDGRSITTTPISHAWVEAYIPDVGWITLDPTYEKAGDYFGIADIQRVALALRSYDPDYPPENIADFTIGFVEQEEPVVPRMEPTVVAKKHVIFPGISYESISVTMPAGVIVDQTGVVVGGDSLTLLGSLAPHQTVHVRSFDFLANAFSSESVQYGVFSSGELASGDIIVQTDMQVTYIPFIALIAGVITIIVLAKLLPKIWTAIRKNKNGPKREKKPKKEKKSKDALVIATDAEGGDVEMEDMLARPRVVNGEEVPTPLDEIRTPASPAQPDEDAAPTQRPSISNEKLSRNVQQEIRKKRPPLIQ